MREGSDRWAEVSLAAIRANVAALVASRPSGAGVLAVVKADAYGHGAGAVAKAALEGGAVGLAVVTPAEAVALRGLTSADRILVMGALTPAAAPAAAALGSALTCGSEALARALSEAAQGGAPVPVHLEIDTGMGRLGCTPDEASALARLIAGLPGVRLAGTFTHFASAEVDEVATRAQFDLYMETLARFDVDPGLRHVSNSAAAWRHPEMSLDAVRAGIAVYGCEWPGLRPAISVRALVTHVKTVLPGHSVGYGSTWTARAATRVATVAIGYADGVMRSRSNRGDVLIRGRRAPLIGRVSMDSITVDVSEIPGTLAGDTATVIGGDGEERITAEEVAGWSGTISYEVLTAIGPRVTRVWEE